MAKLKVSWDTDARVQIQYRYVGWGQTEWFSNDPYWHTSDRSKVMKILTQSWGWKTLGTYGGGQKNTLTSAINLMREFALRIRAQEGDKWSDWQYYAPELYAKPEYAPGVVSKIRFEREGKNDVKISWAYDDMPGTPSNIIRFHIQRKGMVGWKDVALKEVNAANRPANNQFEHVAPIAHTNNLRFRIRVINKMGLHGPWVEMVDKDDDAKTFAEFETLKSRIETLEKEIKENGKLLEWLMHGDRTKTKGISFFDKRTWVTGPIVERSVRSEFLKLHQKTDLVLSKLDQDIEDFLNSGRVNALANTTKQTIIAEWTTQTIPYLQDIMNRQMLDYTALPPI